jgi:hypothetical protein
MVVGLAGCLQIDRAEEVEINTGPATVPPGSSNSDGGGGTVQEPAGADGTAVHGASAAANPAVVSSQPTLHARLTFLLCPVFAKDSLYPHVRNVVGVVLNLLYLIL